ncbi:MAG TPA: sulfatase [Nitrospinae bacterium]|nr:sulfatase [Nitrospinota bacterium]
MEPMNLLVIMGDEHSNKALGCYGHPLVKTPALDRLAAGGARFENAYTNSPICTSARAGFATGRYIHEIGSWDNACPYTGEVPGWGHRLQANGNPVISIGKLHYRNATDPTGFDEQILPMHVRDGVGSLTGSIRDKLPVQKASKLAGEIGPGETSYSNYDLDITETSCHWLEHDAPNGAGRPWMTFVSMVSPHFPLKAPAEFFEMYPLDRIPLPKSHAMDGRPRHPWIEAFREAVPSDDYFDDEKRRIAIAAYFGLCTFLDRNIGGVLESLEKSGLAESTRVIYLSDHGENLGARGTWGNGTMYEESAAVPLIMSGPGIPAGKVVSTPVSLVDIYPTILEAAGVEPGADDAALPGSSLFGIAVREDDGQRAVFSEYHASGAETASYMLRNGRFKYIHYVDFPPELFDLEADPEELNDLAQSPEHGPILREMEASLRGLVNPEEVDRIAKRDQAALIERHGGREAVLNMGISGATPTPGNYADDDY